MILPLLTALFIIGMLAGLALTIHGLLMFLQVNSYQKLVKRKKTLSGDNPSERN